MLRFRFGPFPVTVYLSFLVAAALLSYLWIDPGSISSTDGVALFFAYVVIVFVSVLVHELGHALVGRAFGGSPEIRLEGFGGVTYPRLQERPSAWKQVVLSIAGPVAGLGLGILATAIARAFPPERGSPTANVLALVQWTSVGWAILNLLPVLPLDGGHVLQAFLEGVRRRPSFALASWISAIVAGAVAIFGWYVLRSPFLAIWFALFAINNLTRARLGGQTAQSAPPRRASPLEAERVDVERELERARAAILAADEDTALSAAASLEESEGPYRQAAGLRIRAGVELARGNNQAAGLHAGRSYTLWQSADAAVVAARANLRAGERERAENWLKRALEAGAPLPAVRADPELGQLVS